MGKIRFTLNYEVKEKRKLEDFLDQYQTEIGLRIQESTIERYWKNKDQFQAQFFVETDSKEKTERVYEILTIANKLLTTRVSNWKINGPHENEQLTFECFLNNENGNQPIKWAHLELENE